MANTNLNNCSAVELLKKRLSEGMDPNMVIAGPQPILSLAIELRATPDILIALLEGRYQSKRKDEVVVNLVMPNDVKPKEEKNLVELYKNITPEDLIKFGLIPEFAGRLPVMVTLDSLDKAALVRILKEPKNALIKQYQHFLSMDNVELVFEDGALEAIAEEALRRETGARGLRAIIEGIMRDVMYEVPSRSDIVKCVVTEDTVRKHLEPELIVA